jgi:ubiquinone/menaquinone biosynthesis C-methylase UbiE
MAVTPVNLYDHAYGKYELDVYREVRLETYGEDLGQTSWVSAEESKQIPVWLNLAPTSLVLEIGSGSGRYALRIAESLGCQVTGLEINAGGIRNANQLAQSQNLERLVRFEQCDVAQGLPFANQSFDTAFSNDVLCHIPDRPKMLSELFRVLRPGGHLLFSDALVIGGILSHEEIATRSSIGYYAFSPPGENERLMKQAGLRTLQVTDSSQSAAEIAKRWHAAREERKKQLVSAEGETNFEGLQRFLSCVQLLTSERRLLRYVYLAEKEREEDLRR